jgi:hypothetical protein
MLVFSLFLAAPISPFLQSKVVAVVAVAVAVEEVVVVPSTNTVRLEKRACVYSFPFPILVKLNITLN